MTDNAASDSGSDHENLSHEEILEVSATILNDIIKKDPLLSDLPKGVTVEEVKEQIALQHGQSITIYVKREAGEEIPVVVRQRGARVLDLKHALQRYFALKLARERSTVKISWRYVWKTNYLCFEGQKLKDDLSLLEKYGIHNKSCVSFVKRLREKGPK
ncbi:hypothetical protein R5R35_012548 [Gryllus longicercus]|uniref:SNRNP25 ubiquitin-like domain-containing protein n=1 Tax=Gryllus longicercus TaxID=2509291 RepID=A0AAN9Z2X3_9ORTH